jgi:hypothetical protein
MCKANQKAILSVWSEYNGRFQPRKNGPQVKVWRSGVLWHSKPRFYAKLLCPERYKLAFSMWLEAIELGCSGSWILNRVAAYDSI